MAPTAKAIPMSVRFLMGESMLDQSATYNLRKGILALRPADANLGGLSPDRLFWNHYPASQR